jgi:hypothetical protein
VTRSGYRDDCDDNWSLIMWRGAVTSSLRGKRGQAFLREMVAALDAMPVKALTFDSLRAADGAVCALGAVATARGMDVAPLDPENYDAVAGAFGLSSAMVREIVYMNDEWAWSSEPPKQRWQRMRDWAQGWIKAEAAT